MLVSFDLNDMYNLGQVIYLSLFWSGVTATILYSELFREVREWWWNYFSTKKCWILNKASYLSICALCLGTDLSFIGNFFIYEGLALIDYIILSVICGFISWWFCSIVKRNLSENYKHELDCKLLELEVIKAYDK